MPWSLDVPAFSDDAGIGELVSLVEVGIIIADIVTHGSDFASVATGINSIENQAIAGLLGTAP